MKRGINVLVLAGLSLCWLYTSSPGLAQTKRYTPVLESDNLPEQEFKDTLGRQIAAPQVPEPVRPRRLDPKPIDLSDKRACVLELAELCTFPFVLNRFEGATVRGSLFASQSADDYFTVRELDATV